MALKTSEIVEQSKNAYNQWKDQWRENAKIHKGMDIKTTFMDFANIGVGKALLICGNGYSLEENIETIKKYQDNVDIMVCDKAMGHLIKNDITPTYVMVCDANVDYEQYGKPWESSFKDMIMFNNVCGNTKWTEGSWKRKCLFVNMDSINTEKEFGPLSGCTNYLPAATNVSNQMVVMATQSTVQGRNNWFGYDKIILIGFDYSWRSTDSYYAFDKEAGGKMQYMAHAHCLDRGYNPCYSSSNLIFSSRWLGDYIKQFNLPVISGSSRTLLAEVPVKDLEKQLQYKYKTEDSISVRGLCDLKLNLLAQVDMIDKNLARISGDHLKRYRESI